MDENKLKLIFGSLLHDFGKVLHREGQSKNHSESGYNFLKNIVGIDDKDVLYCVRYHHSSDLKNANLASNELAYITYISDNIAAGIDRREKDYTGKFGFDKQKSLESVFNILNGNSQNKHYRHDFLNMEKGIIYPTDKVTPLDSSFYAKVIDNISDNLKGIDWTKKYVNSLLSVLEANMSFIPSSTNRQELADISLFDHMKISAGVSTCIYDFLEENKIYDYNEELFIKSTEFYDKKAFLLFSMDMSGIQSFIYDISSKGALKALRARSFYLEILMETIIDDLLDELDLTRANVLYTGGGHTYMILPNTGKTKNIIEKYNKKINRWFIENFGTQLYLAHGYTECSSKELQNKPRGSYQELFKSISKKISVQKSNRYTADDIKYLNSSVNDGERECNLCRRSDKLDDANICSVCSNLRIFSRNILENYYVENDKRREFFVVVEDIYHEGLILPNNRKLIAATRNELTELMSKKEYIRSYTKNKLYTGDDVESNLWVGDYSTGQTFDELENASIGVKRLGVLRADVDNLGKAFVSGFLRGDDDKYVTISRTATLSRNLSLFFKGYINNILNNGKYDKLASKVKRQVSIVYSGGDDIFLVGAWNDVISSAVDLKNALEEFTQGTLTISAGFGLYKSGYPVNIMAKDTAKLESYSKLVTDKNSITLFDKNHRYRWDEFTNNVIGEKMELLNKYFEVFDNRGNAFLYNLLELIGDSEMKINLARYVYLLSRLEPDKKSGQQKYDLYRKFSEKMYEWIKNNKDRKELITAIYLYVYLNRSDDM